MIEVENLTAGYDDHVVLNDISLTISDGEIFSIVGRSGSGKSTLLKCLIGFIRPMKGKIFIDRENISSMPERKLNNALLTIVWI